MEKPKTSALVKNDNAQNHTEVCPFHSLSATGNTTNEDPNKAIILTSHILIMDKP